MTEPTYDELERLHAELTIDHAILKTHFNGVLLCVEYFLKTNCSDELKLKLIAGYVKEQGI